MTELMRQPPWGAPSELEQIAVELLKRIHHGKFHSIDLDEEHRRINEAVNLLALSGLADARLSLRVMESATQREIQFVLQVSGFWSHKGILLPGLQPLHDAGWILIQANKVCFLKNLAFAPAFLGLRITEYGEMALSNLAGEREGYWKDSWVGTPYHAFQIPLDTAAEIEQLELRFIGFSDAANVIAESVQQLDANSEDRFKDLTQAIQSGFSQLSSAPESSSSASECEVADVHQGSGGLSAVDGTENEMVDEPVTKDGHTLPEFTEATRENGTWINKTQASEAFSMSTTNLRIARAPSKRRRTLSDGTVEDEGGRWCRELESQDWWYLNPKRLPTVGER